MALELYSDSIGRPYVSDSLTGECGAALKYLRRAYICMFLDKLRENNKILWQKGCVMHYRETLL